MRLTAHNFARIPKFPAAYKSAVRERLAQTDNPEGFPRTLPDLDNRADVDYARTSEYGISGVKVNDTAEAISRYAVL